MLLGRGVQGLDPGQSISRHLLVLKLQHLVLGESGRVMLILQQVHNQRIFRGLELVSGLKNLRKDLLVEVLLLESSSSLRKDHVGSAGDLAPLLVSALLADGSVFRHG